MIPSRILKLASLLLLVIALGGCSSTANTIAGLSTLQSTISGSNYLFFIHPKDGRLVSYLDGLEAGERIRAGDYFSVSLDFGFVRYLQAVDPYVIVYSETWMGNKPRPTDSEKTLRQVVLLKEGMAPNARLPITSIPLLGPVTMRDDLLDVYVTLKVVVLSKKDNQQTIQLVEGLAGQAAAAAPQYSAIAGAAAATVAAFIAQNRDKVEFEHTFAFNPEGFMSEGVKTSPYFSHTILREGQIVVIKGESRFRSIPYPNWYYYLYPLNWFGLSPDGASRRFESDEAPEYTPIGEIIRIPASAIGSLFSDARSDASFWNFLFPGVADSPATTPANLGLDGYQLVRCEEKPPRSYVTTKTSKTEGESKASKSGDDTRKPAKTEGDSKASKSEDDTRKSGAKGAFGEESCRLKDLEMPFGFREGFWKVFRFMPFVGFPLIKPQTTNIYSEKTHMVLRIHKTKGTRGTFDELLSHFSDHAVTINEVTTSSSEARHISQERMMAAFDSAKKSVLYERTKQQIRDAAKRGVVREPDLNEILDGKDKEFLRKLSVKEHVYYTERRILDYARDITDDPEIFCKVAKYVRSVRTRLWGILPPKPPTPDPNPNLWLDGWKLVLENVRGTLFKHERFKKDFDVSTWDGLVHEGSEETCPSSTKSALGPDR